MRGYTNETAGVNAFEPSFITDLTRAVRIGVLAEGRVETPAQAAAAIRAGAYAVVVGTVITRPHTVTSAFAHSVEQAFEEATGSVRALGIDMGGTNTKSGLVVSDGRLLWEDTAPTPAQAGRDGLLAHLIRTAREGLTRSPDATAIGIATAGWVDPYTGLVTYATGTLPGWTGTSVADTIASATGLPVFIENDANALAVGEAEFGAGRGLSDFVCITLGTGVGGGSYTGGRLNRGAHFFANAFGHIPIHPGGRLCNCGQRGCLEPYASASGLLSNAQGRYSSVEALVSAANRGETDAIAAVHDVAANLAIGCNILVQLLDPQALILSGGVVQNNSLLLTALEANLRTVVSVWEQRRLRVLTSPLGYHGGVLGAGAVALQALRTFPSRRQRSSGGAV
jgi:predicted NBD/HSP70 family sugar kinase